MSHKRGAGAEVEVGMMKGGGIPLNEKKVSKTSKFSNHQNVDCPSFRVSTFQSSKVLNERIFEVSNVQSSKFRNLTVSEFQSFKAHLMV